MRNLPTDGTWRKYGKHAPYFGVFGQKKFLSKNLNDNTLSYYFSSGQEYVDDLFALIKSKIDAVFQPEKILDFGCGPGRMVIPFSRHADEVVGLDVSEHMLAEARENCRKSGVKNAVFFVSDDRLNCLSGNIFDLVHSFIVLQHLNIRRGEKLIIQLIDHITDGGIGVLHITYGDSVTGRKLLNFFRFKIPFLYIFQRIVGFIFFRRPIHFNPQMQMNNYNLNRIFGILQQQNVNEVISEFTLHFGYMGVTLYFKKPRA